MKSVEFLAYPEGVYRSAEDQYSPVLVSLREDEAIEFRRSGTTDEGWSASRLSFSFDGKRVNGIAEHSGRDCDGPISSEKYFYFDVDEDGNYETREYRGNLYPVTIETHFEVFDAFARSAGY